MICIRVALPGDTRRIQEIARAAYAKYVGRMGREPAPMSADYGAAIAAGHAKVIASSVEIIGYLIAWPEADAYFVDNIAIDPTYQGGGYGRMLLDDAIASAKRLKLASVRLYTNRAMSENLEVYTHLGFVETHRAVEHGYDRVYMRLSIQG